MSPLDCRLVVVLINRLGLCGSVQGEVVASLQREECSLGELQSSKVGLYAEG